VAISVFPPGTRRTLRGTAAIARDITQRKQAEEALAPRAKRVERVAA